MRISDWSSDVCSSDLPASAQKMVGYWRDWIEEKAGGDLDQLMTKVGDQRAFARVARRLIKDLDLGDEESGDLDDESEGEDDNAEGTQPKSESDGEDSEQIGRAAVRESVCKEV